MRYFVSYGDDSFSQSRDRIRREALDFGVFDNVSIYTPEDLPDSFQKKFDFVLNMKRGGGYYIWKPFVIYNVLSKINEGDIVVYLDAGCSINKRGLARFLEYEQMVMNHPSGIMGMQLGDNCLEKFYTTEKIFNNFLLFEDNNARNTGQIESGILVIRKCENSMNIVKRWLKTVYDNPLLFTDFYNDISRKNVEFIENRHDQSILSVVMKINNGLSIPDETWTADDWESLSDKPFWATRIRG